MTDSVAELIATAERYVRTGAVVEMHLSSGLIVPEIPIVFMSLTEEMLWFLHPSGDHAHGLNVEQITPGDDQQVEVHGDGHIAIISEAWTVEQRDELDRWLEYSKRVFDQLPVSPKPPNIQRYEGRITTH